MLAQFVSYQTEHRGSVRVFCTTGDLDHREEEEEVYRPRSQGNPVGEWNRLSEEDVDRGN